MPWVPVCPVLGRALFMALQGLPSVPCIGATMWMLVGSGLHCLAAPCGTSIQITHREKDKLAIEAGHLPHTRYNSK